MLPRKTPVKLKTFDSCISPSGLLERLVGRFCLVLNVPHKLPDDFFVIDGINQESIQRRFRGARITQQQELTDRPGVR